MMQLAERQYGVASREQLLDIGLSESGIDRRLRSARLHLIHPGVYAIGRPAVSQYGVWLAATMRCGEQAVLSHRSAAALWGIRRHRLLPVDVTTPRSTHVTSKLRRHRASLPSDETTVRLRIRVTTLARTLLDLSSVMPREALPGIVREAEYAHKLDLRELTDVIDRHRGQRGAGSLRLCLMQLGIEPKGRTRSPLEDRFATFVSRHHLPQPELNVLIDLGGTIVEADCLFRRQRLIIELDGHRAHGTSAAFQGDRARDRQLLALGWRTVRVTHTHLDQPEPLLADLWQLLGLDESSVGVA